MAMNAKKYTARAGSFKSQNRGHSYYARLLELGSSERPQCMSICIYCVINSIIFTLPKGLVFPKRQIL